MKESTTASQWATRIGVLDTNILIASSKRQLDPRVLRVACGRVLVSFVAHTEALDFNFNDPAEEARMRQLLAGLEKVPRGEAESLYAIAYRRASRIKFPDAAILATVRAAGADLLTENLADFRGRDAAVRVLALADL